MPEGVNAPILAVRHQALEADDLLVEQRGPDWASLSARKDERGALRKHSKRVSQLRGDADNPVAPILRAAELDGARGEVHVLPLEIQHLASPRARVRIGEQKRVEITGAHRACAAE